MYSPCAGVLARLGGINVPFDWIVLHVVWRNKRAIGEPIAATAALEKVGGARAAEPAPHLSARDRVVLQARPSCPASTTPQALRAFAPGGLHSDRCCLSSSHLRGFCVCAAVGHFVQFISTPTAGQSSRHYSHPRLDIPQCLVLRSNHRTHSLTSCQMMMVGTDTRTT